MKYIILAFFLLVSSKLSAHNYLAPITPFGNLYDQVVYDSLIGETQYELFMITRESFSPEIAIILEKRDASNTENIKWYLKEVKAEAMIWKWKKINETESVVDLKKTNNVIVKKIEIDPARYVNIITAWRTAVKLTRYPEKTNVGLDGTTYQFCSSYAICGETWSPEEGLAYDLVQLGNLLSSIVKSNKLEAEKQLAKANEIANKIMKTH